MKLLDWILEVPERPETVVPGLGVAAVVPGTSAPPIPQIPRPTAVRAK